MLEWKIKRKECALKTFDGTTGQFKRWKERFVDHCCESTQQWRRLLKYITDQPTPILERDLQIAPIGQGYTAWDLATDLESFMIKYVSEGLYGKRYKWTNGEECNDC